MSGTDSGRWSIEAVGRALAALGVILSLLFVGLELRQASQLARAQVRQGLADRNAQQINAISQNRDLARAWAEMFTSAWGSRGVELTMLDTVQAVYALVDMLRHVENVYLQYLEGVVDESVLASYGFRNSRTFVLPQFKPRWEGLRDRFDPRFVEALEAEYGL
jgi:hypothetical protein